MHQNFSRNNQGNFFKKIRTSGKARTGILHLAHGNVETPVFMPVGTQATVKTVRPSDLHNLSYNLILANTYHLYLRPGVDVISGAGGLHKFMGWSGNILTDSGGFQLFSLSDLRKKSEDGYEFQSHIDGSRHILTPEKVIELQTSFKTDIMMVLDECLEQPSSYERTSESLDLTLKWAERSRKIHSGKNQAMFGIVQGGVFPDLRRKAALELVEMDFDGYAIGGVSVGEPLEQMKEILRSCMDVLPEDKPRYLMGVGKPEDLVDFTAAGIDMFDCVVPTRNARGGCFFVPGGHINIRNSRFRTDYRPVEPGCLCYACSNYSRAYIRHLFLAREWLAPILATLHNLSYFATLMQNIRTAIRDNIFDAWRIKWFSGRENFRSDLF